MNKYKKPKVTIAVPAWNEEKNIVRLISSLKSQNRKYFILNKIEVHSDGSTDKTVAVVKKNFKDVKIFDFKKNLGKNERVNGILKNFRGEVLVQVDADIRITDRNVIDNLVKPYFLGRNPGIVCAYHLATPPVTFFEKVAYFGFKVWDRSRKMLGNAGIRYYCEGGMRALSKDFTGKFRLPKRNSTGEDSYSFYFAVSNGFEVEVAKKSKVYIDLASNYRDYARQMKRFLKDPDMVTDTFDQNVTQKYELMGSLVKLKALAAEFIKSPFTGIIYVMMQGFVKLQMPFFRPQVTWQPITRK